LQLVEIIQLVLVGFVGISSIIFLFSYLGFRKRSKQLSANADLTLKQRHQKQKNVSSPKILKTPDAKILETQQKIKSPEQTSNQTVKSNRFQVFKPNTDKEHFPKILKVNPPKKNKS